MKSWCFSEQSHTSGTLPSAFSLQCLCKSCEILRKSIPWILFQLQRTRKHHLPCLWAPQVSLGFLLVGLGLLSIDVSIQIFISASLLPAMLPAMLAKHSQVKLTQWLWWPPIRLCIALLAEAVPLYLPARFTVYQESFKRLFKLHVWNTEDLSMEQKTKFCSFLESI